MTLNLFSNVNLDVDNAKGSHPGVAIEGVDFFATANLTNQIRALSEDMLEFTEAGGTTFDLERIYLELAAGDFLAVRLGRDHLMLGRYMQAYHHALLFQLATARPRLLSFEDEGGPLPAHQVGAEALGDIHLSDTTDLHYAVGVGNGRGRFSDDVLNSGDRNLFKSLLAHLSLRPGALDVGISGYGTAYQRVTPRRQASC